MSEKYVAGHARAILLQTIMQRGLSENIDYKMSQIIKPIALKLGSEAADRKAEELTELILGSKTEAEILKAINAML